MNLATAEKEFAAVIKVAPNNPQSHFSYAQVLAEQKKFKQALVAAEKTKKLDSRFPRVGMLIAEIKRQTNDIKGTVASYDSVLKSDPAAQFRKSRVSS